MTVTAAVPVDIDVPNSSGGPVTLQRSATSSAAAINNPEDLQLQRPSTSSGLCQQLQRVVHVIPREKHPLVTPPTRPEGRIGFEHLLIIQFDHTLMGLDPTQLPECLTSIPPHQLQETLVSTAPPQQSAGVQLLTSATSQQTRRNAPPRAFLRVLLTVIREFSVLSDVDLAGVRALHKEEKLLSTSAFPCDSERAAFTIFVTVGYLGLLLKFCISINWSQYKSTHLFCYPSSSRSSCNNLHSSNKMSLGTSHGIARATSIMLWQLFAESLSFRWKHEKLLSNGEDRERQCSLRVVTWVGEGSNTAGTGWEGVRIRNEAHIQIKLNRGRSMLALQMGSISASYLGATVTELLRLLASHQCKLGSLRIFASGNCARRWHWLTGFLCDRPFPPFFFHSGTWTTSSRSELLCTHSLPADGFTPHLGVVGLIPGGVAPGFSHVGIMPDNATGSVDFLRDHLFTPSLHSSNAPYSPHFNFFGSQDLSVKEPPKTLHTTTPASVIPDVIRITTATTSIWCDILGIKTPIYLELFSAYEAERRGNVKGETATHIKFPITAKRKTLNWRAVLLSCCVLGKVGRDQVHLTEQGNRILGDLLSREVTGCMKRVKTEQKLLK
ncbi:hypothetical protein PR048_032689 [Dryococelus australis]|uniref:Uncharacterized protein n=1 Tax=Dryococelus australis TaxID=614101 RepID=A0ABQ9G2X4_9NEOP|nr:hypothetical protein PR048_032689 [Dryococelus australis]